MGGRITWGELLGNPAWLITLAVCRPLGLCGPKVKPESQSSAIDFSRSISPCPPRPQLHSHLKFLGSYLKFFFFWSFSVRIRLL